VDLEKTQIIQDNKNKLGELGGNISKDNFKRWFVGFSEGEGCFKIKFRGDKSKETLKNQ
jgi:hypothetical protein